jgi:hypothetical protein
VRHSTVHFPKGLPKLIAPSHRHDRAMQEGKALAMTALDVLANATLLEEVVRDFVTPESP